VDQLGGILRITCTPEAQIAGQGLQVGIGDQVYRVHLLEAVLPGGFYEMAHKRGTEATMLPSIGYGHGAFALGVFFGSGISAHSDLDQLAILVGKRDERHLVPVIDLHQMVKEGGADFLDGSKEAEMAGFLGQVTDEVHFPLAIFRPERPDQDVTAVVQGFDPMFTGLCVEPGVDLVSAIGRGHVAYSVDEEATCSFAPMPS
jgi:hypothetical protein